MIPLKIYAEFNHPNQDDHHGQIDYHLPKKCPKRGVEDQKQEKYVNLIFINFFSVKTRLKDQLMRAKPVLQQETKPVY